jgi:hypothetical protein
MLAAQSSAPAADRGAATSALSFARNVGGAVGVAMLGGVFTGRLGLGEAAPGLGSMGALPESARLVFADAISGVFAWAGPIMLLGAVLLAFLPNVNMHRNSPEEVRLES